MITLKLLVWVAVIGGFVWRNYRVIEIKKQRPFYLLDNILKGMAFIVYGVVFWDTQYELRTLNLLLFCLTSFWIIFDIALNTVRGKSPWYIGPTSGWIDKFGVRYEWAYWALKLLALYVLFHTTYNIYTRFE